MKIKIASRFFLTPVKMSTLKNSDKNAGNIETEKEPLDTAGGNAN